MQHPNYVTPDYHVDLPSGEPTVYYRFGGRAVAWHNNSTIRYLLGDHLTSTHGETNESQADTAERRYFPFGGDRSVSGAADLSRDERFTGQRRVDTGNGNARQELYHYGARAYLPGVGIFTQPDSVAPDFNNPQSLNRYAYALNNPLLYVDPTGHYVMFVNGMGTDNYDEEDNKKAWGDMIENLGLKDGDYGFFNWGSSFGGASNTRGLKKAAQSLASRLEGQKDIKLIAHSRGGSLVMEFMALLNEGKLGTNDKGAQADWVRELKGAYTIDSPLDGKVQAQPFIANTRYSTSLLTEHDRFAYLPQQLARKGITVDMANFDNPEDWFFTSHSAIPGIQYFSYSAKPPAGYRIYWDAAHGLLQHDRRVASWIGGGRPIACH